jgi:putative thioredoxin
MADVTDATFEIDVIERSATVPVVVDLWAPWCGPCTTLGPLIEKVIGATGGQVELMKVNVDENPQVSQAFQVQGIPAVFALVDGQVVDHFVGAQGEQFLTEFVAKLLPADAGEVTDADDDAADDAPVDDTTVAAPEPEVMTADQVFDPGPSAAAPNGAAQMSEPGMEPAPAVLVSHEDGLAIEARLLELLDQVKADDDARQEFIDLLDALGPADPRTASYRRQLTNRLY